jgi:hypothetical protein
MDMSLVAISTLVRLPAQTVAIAMVLGGCSQKNRCFKEGAEVQIQSDHPHSATVSGDLVKRGRGGMFVVHGNGHGHLFVLKDEEMQQLRRGEPVSTRTSSSNAHAHEITARCKE